MRAPRERAGRLGGGLHDRLIGALPGQRFAVIVDEAHSSQSGESTKSLKAVLASRSLEEAEQEEAEAETPEEELENAILEEIHKWKGAEERPEGDLYVRSGPRTDRLSPDSAKEYIRTRFPQASRFAEGSSPGTP